MTQERFSYIAAIVHFNDSHQVNFDSVESAHQLPDGTVFLGNSGNYLIKPSILKAVLPLFHQYVEQMTDEEAEAFNELLQQKRKADRIKESKALEKKRKEVGKTTFIYVMHNRRNGLYKIGRAKDPTYREQTLQAEEPEIEMVFCLPGVEEIEIDLHRQYASRRVRGEWFKLTEEDLIDIRKKFQAQ